MLLSCKASQSEGCNKPTGLQMQSNRGDFPHILIGNRRILVYYSVENYEPIEIVSLSLTGAQSGGPTYGLASPISAVNIMTRCWDVEAHVTT